MDCHFIMSLRGRHLLFLTKQSPIIRRLLRLRTRVPRSDIIDKGDSIFSILFASMEWSMRIKTQRFQIIVLAQASGH